MKTRCLLLISLFICTLTAHSAEEIGFGETFALADDRAAVLEQLIPGTQDYYFYHCLHAQQTGDRDTYDKMLELWIKRHNYNDRVNELRVRQAFLDYETNPETSIAFIRKELGLTFSHSRISEVRQSSAPTALDQKWIAFDTLLTQAFKRHKNLQGFEDAGLAALAGKELDELRRRDLLGRLRRPDYPGLAERVVADLKAQHSKGFGAMAVHGALTREQLDTCARLMPELLKQDKFVHTYLVRLQPGHDVDLVSNDVEQLAHLERLWNFVSPLEPVHNALKVHVLYRRLEYDRRHSEYDPDRLMTYLKLPRRANYVEPNYLKRRELVPVTADLGADFRMASSYPPVQNDEALVRDYLLQVLRAAPDYQAYASYVRDDFLKQVFAESKIVNGVGDVEQWASLLTPAQFQALKERVDIDFTPHNPQWNQPDSEIVLDVDVKNVETLLVNIYILNTFNYYREHGKEVETSVNLDGLVASHQRKIALEESPFHRVRRSLTFPELKERGVYVVELIGNGRSSRAVVRKGRLNILERPTPAGHAFTVLDEASEPVSDAEIWIAGRSYTRGDRDEILVPYTSSPGAQPLVVRQGAFASLSRFQHQAENYVLTAGFYTDREELLRGGRARVVVRPVLSLNGMPVSLELLENVRLSVSTIDQDQVSSSATAAPFELPADREASYAFQVPENLRSVHFTLSAKVKNISRNKEEDLAASDQVSLNGIQAGQAIQDAYVSRSGKGYVLEIKGRNGEILEGEPVALNIKHHWFRDPVDVSLQTDKKGRVELGELDQIDYVRISKQNGHSTTWEPVRDQCERRGTLNGPVGKVLQVPVFADGDAAALASLFELRGGVYASDRSDALGMDGGYLTLSGLEAGDYELFLKEENRTIRVRITGKASPLGYAVSPTRALELMPVPLQVTAVKVGAKEVSIQVAASTHYTRVHVFGTRYQPAYGLFGKLGFSGTPEPARQRWVPPETQYLSGRNIGDEYRYILERRFAAKFPGNMLERPSLLLNPWSLGVTEAAEEELARDEALRKLDTLHGGSAGRGGGGKRQEGGDQVAYADLDFLGRPAAVLLNLEPDEKGLVTIDRALLDGLRQMCILAVDPAHSVVREVVLDDKAFKTRDLRLAHPLDPALKLAEQKLITAVTPGQPFGMIDATTTRFQAYRSLAEVFRYFTAIGDVDKLQDFSFLLDWPDLDDQQKREKYVEFACHELHVFLAHKDPAFFKEVVRPFLADRRHKTFIDRWLLEEDLSDYLVPERFNRLNAAEKAFLGQRINEHRGSLARHMRERWELIPPDPEQFDMLFRAALHSGALEEAPGADGLAFGFFANSADAASDPFGLGAMPAALPQAVATMRATQAGTSLSLAKKARADGRSSGSGARETMHAALGDVLDSKMERLANGPAAMDMVTEYDNDTAESYFLGRGESMTAERGLQRRLFVPLDKTEEWAESSYYRLPSGDEYPDLVPVNAFWKDYAAWNGEGAFLSGTFYEAYSSLPDMLFAMAVLDLPFKADAPETSRADGSIALKAGQAIIVFHQEVRESREPEERTPVLVSQNFFRADDRYRHENNERFDKFVTEEFLQRVVYGCQVILTNPTSSPLKLQILLQVPQGSLPVQNGFYTRGFPVRLEPFSTRTMEFYFYFPETGSFPHFPVQVARNEEAVAQAEPFVFNVVQKLSKIDKEAWPYLSQYGSDAEVLAYLEQHNIERVDLNMIAFRMKEKGFFGEVLDLLRGRHVYQDTLWSYGVFHVDPAVMREYLPHTALANRCGRYFRSPLLDVDPIERKLYEHLEYSPLVNPRAHQVGKERKILNHRFRAQYQSAMQVLGYKTALDDEDRLGVVYYLFLQDRVQEALDMLAKVDGKQVAEKMPLDYLRAYAAFYTGDLDEARRLAQAHADCPVPRWQQRFENILNHLAESEGLVATAADDENREQSQDQLAATEPSLELKVESGIIRIEYRNLKACKLNFYPMDIELLFSRNPFVQQQSARFSMIAPRETLQVDLPANIEVTEVELPKDFRGENVMVEVVAGGIKRSQAYYANELSVQVIGTYGQVKVGHLKTRKPLPGTYIKVYGRLANGEVVFHKDGYTDLRGRFDYTSVNADDGRPVERFSILVLHDKHGAVIRETEPPKS